MFRRILTVGVAVAALLAGSIAAAPGPAAAKAASIVVGTAYAIPGSCFKHPYIINGTTPDSTLYHVTADIDVTGPLGEYADSDYAYGDTTSFTYDSDVFLCDSLDRRGTYTIKVDLEWCNYGYSICMEETQSATFQYLDRPAPPPPPPPTPTPTPTPVPVTRPIDGTLATPKYTKRTRVWKATARSEAQVPNVNGTPVTWKTTVNGATRAAVVQSWGESYVLRVRLPQKKTSKRYTVAVTENGVRVYSTSIRVPARS